MSYVTILVTLFQLQNCMMGLHGDVTLTFSIAITSNQLYIAPESICSHRALVVPMTYKHACWKLYTVSA